MDCLESLLTNQYSDLKKIFAGEAGRAYRRTALQIPGMVVLADLSAKNNIKSWIVGVKATYPPTPYPNCQCCALTRRNSTNSPRKGECHCCAMTQEKVITQ